MAKNVLAKLVANRELAFLSQDLATIKRDIPLEYKLDDCQVKAYDKEKMVQIFTDLNFVSLIKLLPSDEFEDSVQDSLF